MHVFDGGDTIVLGDLAATGTLGIWPDGLRTRLLGLVAALVPLAALAWFEPLDLNNFGLVAFLEAVCLGVFLLFRNAIKFLVPSEPVAAIFKRSSATAEITYGSIFGLTRTEIPFSDIAHVRLTRGEWINQTVSERPVLILDSRQAIALPASMSERELTLLRTLTGLP